MGYRTALKPQAVLPFASGPCRIRQVLGRGAACIVYSGYFPSPEGTGPPQSVLVRELFPAHPQGRIQRDPQGHIRIEPDAEMFFTRHKESFLTFREVHERWLTDHPALSGLAAQRHSCNGTLYSTIPFSEITTLRDVLDRKDVSLAQHVDRMLGLLDTLESHHKCGYLHLGISPDQILLAEAEGKEIVCLLQNDTVPLLRDPDQDRVRPLPGYTPPELENGTLDMADFSSDLYAVTAVFFTCLMGRPMTLEELLFSGTPSVRESLCLREEPYPVRQMVNRILKKGLQVLPAKRYRSVGQMRNALRELQARIRCQGVTHWSVWEVGRREALEWARMLPPQPEGELNHWLQQGKRYSPSVPALIRLSLTEPDCLTKESIFSGILRTLGTDPEPPAISALEQLLHGAPEKGPVLLVLTGQKDLSGLPPELGSYKGLRILTGDGSDISETGWSP